MLPIRYPSQLLTEADRQLHPSLARVHLHDQQGIERRDLEKLAYMRTDRENTTIHHANVLSPCQKKSDVIWLIGVQAEDLQKGGGWHTDRERSKQ